MNKQHQTSSLAQAGFSLLELALVCAILSVVLASVFSGISTTIQRSQAEQTKVDLTQEGREFVDEFERDLHQAGYPNCRMAGTTAAAACPADYSAAPSEAQSSSVAVGLVYLSNTKVIFEGAVDGSGTVYSIQYRLVDKDNNDPPTTACPCTLQRSEVAKDPANNKNPWAQGTNFSQELQNVVNSGVPGGTNQYGGGLAITGNTYWGATNSAYYAAISTFKDYPVFQAYDQSGNIIALPLDLSVAGTTPTLTCPSYSVSCVKSIRLTINLLANATTGADMKTNVRPVTTLVGTARMVNNVLNN
jgi:prepilin-type N-terminal cleavage/methylation domain-containing protein